MRAMPQKLSPFCTHREPNAHPIILIFFSASSIRPHPMNEACLNESRHTCSTSTAVSPPVYRILTQKPDKLALATHYLLHWEQKGAHPPVCADDFPCYHAPCEDTAAFRILRNIAYLQIYIPEFQLLSFCAVKS